MKLFDLEFFLKSIPQILTCLPVTLIVSFVSFFFSVVIGFTAAIIKIYKVPVLDKLTTLYISFIRGTPVLVQLYIICYGIPKVIYYTQLETGALQNIDINVIPGMVYVLIAYSFNIGAYMAETIRGAILSVDKGQMEACITTGMTTIQGYRHIVLPQAFRLAIPSLMNNFIECFKGSSLCSMVGVVDMMLRAKMLANKTYRFIEVYLCVLILYWILNMIFVAIQRIIERKAGSKY